MYFQNPVFWGALGVRAYYSFRAIVVRYYYVIWKMFVKYKPCFVFWGLEIETYLIQILSLQRCSAI